VLILQVVKVVYFHTLLQVLTVKVVSPRPTMQEARSKKQEGGCE
jgi:hypothetical protein